jgi:uncharacterized protein
VLRIVVARAANAYYNIQVQFTWDPSKAAGNLKRHKVSFEEAKTVFDDVDHIARRDDDNADAEARVTVLGFSSHARLLFVVAFEVEVSDDGEELIRIIGARRATAQEEIQYATENQS